MKKFAVIAARLLLGLIFFVFGLNGFFVFIEPPEHTLTSGAFINLLISTGFIYFEKSLEIIGGVLLLLNQYVPLALAILAPIVVNILLFHFLMERYTLAAGLIPFALWTFLAWEFRQNFAGLFERRAKIGENDNR